MSAACSVNGNGIRLSQTYISWRQQVENVEVFPFVQVVVNDRLEHLLIAHRIRQIRCWNRMHRSELIVAGDANLHFVLPMKME